VAGLTDRMRAEAAGAANAIASPMHAHHSKTDLIHAPSLTVREHYPY
jgi:hypothetical protein